MSAVPSNNPAVTTASPLRRGLVRALGLALVWVGLNGLDAASWRIGAPVVLLAAWVSMRLLPAGSWRWSGRGAAVFAAYFLRESLRGGWDVAWRALSPGLGLSPALVSHPLRLPPGPWRLFFCSTISLLPGTAVVAIGDRHVCVHVLDNSPAAAEELRKLEGHVAALFGLELMKEKEAVA